MCIYWYLCLLLNVLWYQYGNSTSSASTIIQVLWWQKQCETLLTETAEQICLIDCEEISNSEAEEICPVNETYWWKGCIPQRSRENEGNVLLVMTAWRLLWNTLLFEKQWLWEAWNDIWNPNAVKWYREENWLTCGYMCGQWEGVKWLTSERRENEMAKKRRIRRMKRKSELDGGRAEEVWQRKTK